MGLPPRPARLRRGFSQAAVVRSPGRGRRGVVSGVCRPVAFCASPPVIVRAAVRLLYRLAGSFAIWDYYRFCSLRSLIDIPLRGLLLSLELLHPACDGGTRLP